MCSSMCIKIRRREVIVRALTSIVFLWSSLSAVAQINVSGLILDEGDQSPLIGVNIISKSDPLRGTTSGIEGDFTFELNQADTLLVSYIGYQSQEIFVDERNTNLTIYLLVNNNQLDEVVVVGYGTQKRSQITGSVSVVLADDINKTANLRVEQALQGRSSGVQITQASGSPGNALSVRIRGIGTPLNSDPLYIVDGVWVDGIDFLNPADIESISVLKDAASVAIYGTSGANGVVLITTKEGKSNRKATLSFDTYYGSQQVAKQVDLLSASQYAELMIEADRNNPLNIPSPTEIQSSTNWQDEIFITAPMYSAQLSALGGNEKSTYGISGSYFDQQGIVGKEKSQFTRYNARVKLSTQATQKLKINTNINYIHLSRDALPENNEFASPVAFALNIDPITTPYKDDGTPNFSKIVTGDTKNPINRIQTTYNNYTADRIIGLVGQEFEIVNNLLFRTNASMDLTYYRTFGFGPTYNLDPSGAFVHERVDQNGVSKSRGRNVNLLLENLLDYKFTIIKDHQLSALLGTSYRDRNSDGLFVGLADLPANDPAQAFITGQTITEENKETRSIGEFVTESTLISYFGRLNYEFQNKYFFSASLRRDGSSRFGDKNKFAMFPAFSAGWLITEDLKIHPSINYLKFRVSWGKNGNEASLGNYGFTSVIDPVRYVFGSNQILSPGRAPTTPSNPDLKWEVSTQFDIGIDLAFLDDKITLASDYFIKRTGDLLIPASILATAGSGINESSPPFTNVGTMENTGVELALGYKGNLGPVKMDHGFNISFIRNEVKDLGEFTAPFSAGYNQGIGGNTTRMEIGQPMGYYYGYQTIGVFQNQFEVQEYLGPQGQLIQPRAKAGDFIFADLDNDGRITSADQTFLGSPYPDFFLGLSSQFTYQEFDFNLFLQGVYGNEIVNATTRYDLRVSNLPANRYERWTEDNPSSTEPRVSLSDLNANFRFSDYFVEDGSFVRIKSLQLGYSLNDKILEKLSLSKFRIYASGQNLITFTNYKGLDPEIGKQNPFDNSIAANLDYGIDRGLYPAAKVFIVGLNVQF